MLLCPVLVLVLAAAALARVMDRVDGLPRGWQRQRAASPDEPIFLRIALKQQPERALALDQAVLDMSTPGHPNYGMHMTRDELRSYTAPSDTSVSVVTQWLREHAIQPWVDHDWVSFTTTVRIANELLDTQFAWYRYLEGTGAPVLRALAYSVPDRVAAHIDLVQPTTRFGHLGARRSTIFETFPLESGDDDAGPGTKNKFVEDDPSCAVGVVTLSCLRFLYNIHYKPTASGANKVAFASFLEEYARYDDLATFEDVYMTGWQGLNFTVELVNGGDNDQHSIADSMEANLDAQYLLGISHPIPLVEYSVGGRGPLVPTANQPSPPGSNEPYLEFLLYMASLNDSALPQTISTSYGEEEQSVPRDYALKVCDMFKQLGARGVSVLFASGDSGPGNRCESNTNNATYFESMFPAGCPWVTAVGGTTGGTTSNSPERAASFSSGGFSIYHAQPVWQRDAVGTYLKGIGQTYSQFFNRSGRGIPDISAQSQGFSVCNGGKWSSIGGTSASTPVVAGIVALLNAARKAQGKPPLGFLNPWLYNNSAAFTDITTGAAIGCASRAEFGGDGAWWNATTGWDPVTGLGTPLFDKLLELAAPGTNNA
ncbi:3b4ce87e-23c5-4d6f-9497-59dc2eff6b60 [Thermothielavioides terrestris]|uniref:tripeptidyl-peptidase II n=1 Tax=Thermothielavioides terrestris TaxID=2587410 RepID=A0A446BX38_9PEZI|nr:3b4ce87e-23c5-4d6f-9497-59dc2eff6b60 [Thermothielavioides terrestris]